MKNYIILFILIISLSSQASGEWQPGDNWTDTRDGQIYKTVVIGNQVWMAENLNIGSVIPSTKPGSEMSDNDIIEKYCWENEEGNCDGSDGKMKRGGFYEWEEALQYWDGQPKLPVQGICPEGWHIPSNTDWNELIGYLGNNPGPKLLDGGESGFNGLLTGYRCTMNGSFRVSAMNADTRTYFWSSEQVDDQNAPLIELGANSFTAFAFQKSLGVCVRCILDASPNDVKDFDQSFLQDELSISPNPVLGRTRISYVHNEENSGIVHIYIIDLLGNVVHNITNMNYPPGKYDFTINAGELDSGFYYVIAKTVKFVLSKTITVLK